VELRSPQYARLLGERVTDMRAVAFVDGARLWIIDPLPQQQDTFNLMGGGIGFRLAGLGGLYARADLGWPFRDAFQTTAWQPRIQFIANFAF
jgi:hemolysin activation/secretion protein